MILCLLLVQGVAPALPAQDGPGVAAGAAWRYVAPEDLSTSDARLLAVPLSTAAPEDVEVRLPASGGRRRFGQLRFGVAASTRVAFALDEVLGAEPILFVDCNRDRRLDAGERAQRDSGSFVVTLHPRLDGKGREADARIVRFRLSATGTVLGVATHGHMEGEVSFGGRRMAARRYDGNGNGLFTDADDRLWLDLDGDRQEDPVREIFPYRAVQAIDGKLWVVRGDEAGLGFSLQELTERGKVVVELTAGLKPLALAVTLASTDGVVAGVADAGVSTTVPAGTYRVTNLQLTLADPANGQPWSFVFAQDDEGGRTWKVEPDATVTIDPLADPDFRIGAEDLPVAGGTMTVRLGFTLSCGLYLVTCFRGDVNSSYSGTGADVLLLDEGGKLLDTTHSGFA